MDSGFVIFFAQRRRWPCQGRKPLPRWDAGVAKPDTPGVNFRSEGQPPSTNLIYLFAWKDFAEIRYRYNPCGKAEQAMKVLTTDDAAAILQTDTVERFLFERARELCPAGEVYSIPRESESRTALAKFLGCLLMRNSEVCVYLTRWNMRPHSEHLDLLYAYRRSAGETRPLSVAPVHLFDRSTLDPMISMLCLILHFELEAWVFDFEGETLARLDHRGMLELRTTRTGNADIRNFATDPEKFLKPLLALGKSA
jgi:hypothetical protein